MTGWSDAELDLLGAAAELVVAPRRADGGLAADVPVWVVVAGAAVVVRTWHRRDTGWFGRVLRSGRAQVTVPGLVADVLVEDVGATDPALRAAVDAAYRAKYARYGVGTVERMVGDEAAAATLRLEPDQGPPRPGGAPVC